MTTGLSESQKRSQRNYRIKNRSILNEKQKQRIRQPDGQGCVYKIWSENSDAVYIGSTTYKLERRFSCHNIKYSSFQRGDKKAYCSSFEVLKHGDCHIEELEKIEDVESRSDLHSRERYWISENRAVAVNKNTPGNMELCSSKEEYHRAYNRLHREKYRETIERAVNASNKLRAEFRRLCYILMEDRPHRGRPKKVKSDLEKISI